MKEPLVSIIVPAYNVEKYIACCLDSILQQTYNNIEIIIVNDGSTDGTLHFIQQYINYSNVKIVNQENVGLSGARNTGIKYAKGEYICFVDSDDWIEKDTIEKGINSMDKLAVDVILWGYIKEFTQSTMKQSLAVKKEVYMENNIHLLYQRIVGPVREQLNHPEYVDSYITAWGKLYKTSIIRDNNIEFVSTKKIGTEDLLFNIQYFAYVKSAVILPDCLNHYRKNNSSSLTSTYKAKLFTQWTLLQDLIWDKIQGNSLLEEAYYNRIACTMIGLGLNELSAELSYKEHKKNIMMIWKTERYQKAFCLLKYAYLPFHWKVFFLSCRFRLFFLYWFLIKVIQKIIYR